MSFGWGSDLPPTVPYSRAIFTSSRDSDSETAIWDAPLTHHEHPPAANPGVSAGGRSMATLVGERAAIMGLDGVPLIS